MRRSAVTGAEREPREGRFAIGRVTEGSEAGAAAGGGLGPDDLYVRHPRMPLSERAKIFMPFNPLKGFEEALREKEREVEREALDEWGGNDVEAPDVSAAGGSGRPAAG
ncbi:MAG: hypothetical protein PUG35_06430 [Olsenella sp.]|nr:hypothetical protein [Olsenella sp.]